MSAPLTVTVSLEIEVDERQWAAAFGAGDAYDRADAQARRSLVADVEDYVHGAVAQSAAAVVDGAIVSVEVARDDSSKAGTP